MARRRQPLSFFYFFLFATCGAEIVSLFGHQLKYRPQSDERTPKNTIHFRVHLLQSPPQREHRVLLINNGCQVGHNCLYAHPINESGKFIARPMPFATRRNQYTICRVIHSYTRNGNLSQRKSFFSIFLVC